MCTHTHSEHIQPHTYTHSLTHNIIIQPQTHTHTHACTHTHAHTHACTHTHTYTRTCAHTHTYTRTHTQTVVCLFPYGPSTKEVLRDRYPIILWSATVRLKMQIKLALSPCQTIMTLDQLVPNTNLVTPSAGQPLDCQLVHFKQLVWLSLDSNLGLPHLCRAPHGCCSCSDQISFAKQS